MVPDTRVLSSMKNEQKYLWQYDSVVHQGYLMELNDRPRANHPGDNTYLLASGNLVCIPEEDQVSNTCTEVQPNNALPDLLDGPRPITGIHGRCHRNSFEVEAQRELNDRPRANHLSASGNLVSHPEEDLSASGNLVCHPEEDQVSNTHTEVQPNNALPDVLDGPRPITGIHGRWH